MDDGLVSPLNRLCTKTFCRLPEAEWRCAILRLGHPHIQGAKATLRETPAKNAICQSATLAVPTQMTRSTSELTPHPLPLFIFVHSPMKPELRQFFDDQLEQVL